MRHFSFIVWRPTLALRVITTGRSMLLPLAAIIGTGSAVLEFLPMPPTIE